MLKTTLVSLKLQCPKFGDDTEVVRQKHLKANGEIWWEI